MDDDKKEYITFPNGKRINKKTWIMATLRRASYRWPARNEAVKLARVDRGLYKCAMCEGTFLQKETAIDHIEPVVPFNGFPMHPLTTEPDWTIIIDRLFCDVTGFQILCHQCHDSKTMSEDTLRANYNKERKDLEKEEKKLAKSKKIK